MKTQKSVNVVDFSINKVAIPIIGISPLITHRFGEKSRKIIEDKKLGKAKNKKYEICDPNAEYEEAKHKSPQGWEGFPVSGFKAAMIRAAKGIGLVMKDTQMSFFIDEDCPETQLVRIEGKSRMRTDHVRVGMGSADVRYRPEYVEWSATLNIQYNEGMISLDQIYQLVKAAGYCCGIGEMRPEKTKFNYGRFRLAQEK